MLGDALLDYGRCLLELGRFQKAESSLLESASILEKADPVHIRSVATSLASLYERWGNPSKAAEWRKRSDTGATSAPSNASGIPPAGR